MQTSRAWSKKRVVHPVPTTRNPQDGILNLLKPDYAFIFWVIRHGTYLMPIQQDETIASA